MLSGTPRTFVGSTTFSVAGMTCANCARAVTEEISSIPGVAAVLIEPASSTVTVTASRQLDRADIAAAVEAAGHALVP
ncbi:heavy-metal-associated domain-containing protein [Nocardioides mesophilus]|uniref:Heavy-metal-associated domain-containing protein n=1 Tax=Nocardioides mesophilus TaxID=433659 RepID=A0A7G9R8B2_9ACTN|nr:heavy-metal-associated domain-containing protein [Nocardioides mesophilus]QNN51837.1 heavy-metal-associated domain-containing protein [Nocardioides mesophilus]